MRQALASEFPHLSPEAALLGATRLSGTQEPVSVRMSLGDDALSEPSPVWLLTNATPASAHSHVSYSLSA